MAAVPSISPERRRACLAHRHRLLPGRRCDDVDRIAADLVALHSSDPVTVYLSTLTRMATPSVGAVEDALYAARTVIRHHAMRRTLWVTTPAVMRPLHATTTARYAPVEHRRVAKMLQDNGIEDGDAWLSAAKRDVLTVLTDEGPMTARALGHRVPALAHPMRLGAGTSYEVVQAAHTRVLLQLGMEGQLVRTRPVGSWVSGQYTWAALAHWLPGALDPMDERQAACQAVRHWLRAFGPATTTDLRWYMGWTAATARRALADTQAVAVHLPGSGGSDQGWVAPEDLDDHDTGRPADGEPWVAVLPGLDPTTMGWKQREFYLPPASTAAFDRNGNAGPTVWVDGRVVGGWAQTRDGELRLIWFEAVPARRRRQVADRLEEVRDWVGDARFSLRFPAPYTKALLAGDEPEHGSEGVNHRSGR